MSEHDFELQRGTETLFTVSDFADYVAASDDGRYIVGFVESWVRKRILD